MGALGELLELLHGGPEPRFRTAVLEYRTWTHAARSSAAFRAATAHQRGASGTWRVGKRDEPREEHVAETRLWIEHPGLLREERSVADFGDWLGIRDGARWWTYNERHGAASGGPEDNVTPGIAQEAEALFEPATLLGLLRFEPLGAGERLGRPTLRARAVPRPLSDHDSFGLHRLGFGADEYSLDVDAKRGIVLWLEARREGEPFHRRVALAAAFDVPIAPDRFVFIPPPGETVVPAADRARPRHMTLPEATREAPFTVLAPERVPAGWDLHVTMFTEPERFGGRTSVGLAYRSPEAAHGVSIGQVAEADAREEWTDDDGVETRRVERDGVVLLVRERTPEFRVTHVRRELAGTRATVSSTTLGTDELIAYALALRPYEPPA